MSRVEAALESLVFRSRWLLAPFFVGLIFAIVALLVKFLKQLWALAAGMFTLTSDEMIINILTLVDSSLIAALLLIIAFSGYENFVSKIGTGEHEDRPALDGQGRFLRPQDQADRRHRGNLGCRVAKGVH